MNRITIFSFYSKEGKVYCDTENLLKKLRLVSDYIIVVVNGDVEDSDKLDALCDVLVFRENKGLDSGAYKSIIFNQKFHNLIKNANELIFCNSTFIGPFLSIENIFEDMEHKKADFWGLVFFDNGFIRYLQSYFLVFRKSVIEDMRFYDYFEEFIDENTKSFQEVCCFFEVGLFEYLVKLGYQYDAYVKDLKYNIYINPYMAIKQGVPIIKKKFFLKNYNHKVLEMILEEFSKNELFDENDLNKAILESFNVKDDLNFEITKDNIEQKGYIEKSIVSISDVINYTKNHSEVFIFGTGIYGLYIRHTIEDEKIRGFVVSDDFRYDNDTYFGKKIYSLEEAKRICKNNKDIGFIVGLSVDVTRKLKNKFSEFPRPLFLWKT